MTNKTTAGAMLALSILSPATCVFAAASSEPVIVTATRTPQIADASVAPVIVITRQQLQQNPNADIADLLQMYAGIEIGRNGGPGQSASVFIRGANSNQTLVMIDGVKINPGTLGNAPLQNIDLSMIDHIEVVLGPRSTLYGSEAIGGVINIITRQRKKNGSDFSAAISGGSYNTRSIRISADNRKDDRAAGIQISGTRSDGFPTRADSSIDSGFKNLNLHLYGNKRIGDTHYNISHWQSTGTTDYLNNATTPLSQDFENTTTAITAKAPVTSNWASTLKLSHISDRIDQNQIDIYSNNRKDFAHTSRYAIDWQNDIQWHSQNLLTAGLYRSQENTAALSYGTQFDTNNYTNAVYAQNVLTTTNNSLITGLRFTNNQIYGDHSTWNLEYGANLTSSLRVTMANNSGFRAPTSTDLYGYGGNVNLKPEESVNNEIGLRYQFAHTQRVSLNVFRNRIRNLIVYDNATSQNQNVQQATITGSELTYELSGQHWGVRASTTVQDPHNDTRNKQLSRRSEQAYSLALSYRTSQYSVALDTYHSGSRPDIDINTYAATTLPPYTLVNLNGTYRISHQLSLNVRIENLADEHYQLVDGYNTPGRSAYAELRYAME
ncbi:MAG: TonB-dependent receptor [Gammaproteobacteria bacterium]